MTNYWTNVMLICTHFNTYFHTESNVAKNRISRIFKEVDELGPIVTSWHLRGEG